MARSRGTEMPQPPQQRLSPRSSLHPRTTTSSSDSSASHQSRPRRTIPKQEVCSRRSPRAPLVELPAAVNQKKRGTRVADLETKLGHAKDELRKLKEQLASAEAAKRNAQHELEETKKMIPSSESGAGDQPEEASQVPMQIQGGDEPLDDVQGNPVEDGGPKDGSLQIPEEGGESDDVRDLVVTAEEVKGTDEDGRGQEAPPQHVSNEVVLQSQEEAAVMYQKEDKLQVDADVMELSPAENTNMKKQLAQGEAENEILCEGNFPDCAEVNEPSPAENTVLKKQLAEAEAKAAAAQEKEEEMAAKLTLAGKELQEAKSTAKQLREQLQAAEAAKAVLEAEMKRMAVQTEQWRKAAEAAAAVLSGPEARASSRVNEERRASMDENKGGAGYEGGGGFSGLWSPLATVELEEGLGVGRRKGGGGVGGIRVLGELWKRRSQQQRRL